MPAPLLAVESPGGTADSGGAAVWGGSAVSGGGPRALASQVDDRRSDDTDKAAPPMFSETLQDIVDGQVALLSSMHQLHAKVDSLSAGGGSPSHFLGGAGCVERQVSPLSSTLVVRERPQADATGSWNLARSGRSSMRPPGEGGSAVLSNHSKGDVELLDPHTQSPRLDEFRVSVRRPGGVSTTKPMTALFSIGGDSVEGVDLILPQGWPGTLKRRDRAREARATQLQREISTLLVSEQQSGRDSASTEKMSRIRDPNMCLYQFLHFIGIFMLTFDLTAVPYIVAWDVEMGPNLLVISWSSASYWTIVMCLNFFKGYYRNMTLILSYRQIAHRYLSTWFILDFGLVMADWCSLLLEANASYKLLRFQKVLKTSRVFMALKILRAIKVRRQLQDAGHFNSIKVGAHLTMILVAAVWVNHLIGCAWFMCGDFAPSDTGRRWLDIEVAYGGDMVRYKDMDQGFQYATSLHWAIAQSTLGAMEIGPSNTAERFMTIACLRFGLLVGSTIVSSMSASMVHMQTTMHERQREIRNLQRFLIEHNVSLSVSSKVEAMIRQRYKHRARLTPDDVPSLDLLPSSLKEVLHAELCTPLLTSHPLLRIFCHFSAPRFQLLCTESVSLLHPRSGDEVFFPGNLAKGAYCVMSGQLVYERIHRTERVPSGESGLVHPDETVCEEGTWLAEAALWVEWTHIGKAAAAKDSQLLLIDGVRLSEVLAHGMYSRWASEYGRGYFQRITALTQDVGNMPDDLDVPCTDFADIVRSMSVDLRMKVALATFEMQEQHSLLSSARLIGNLHFTPEMRSEVQRGAAVFVPDSGQKIKRVVSVAVLRLRNRDGHVLTQLAEVPSPPPEGDGSPGAASAAAAAAPVAGCRLPGTKQTGQETTQETIRRFLSARLKPFVDLVEWERIEQDVTQKRSDRYHFFTVYARSICVATFNGDPELFSTKEIGAVGDDAGIDEVPLRLRGLPLYFFYDASGGGGIYTWLDGMDFDFFSSSEGTAQLQSWLSGLGPLHDAPCDEHEAHASLV